MKRTLFDPSHGPGDEEFVEELLRRPGVRIERIVSRGHSSPPGFWYDQDETEWVVLVSGGARLSFERRGEPVELGPGDWIEIAAHERHRVDWTDPDRDTVWLAVFVTVEAVPPPTARLAFEPLTDSHLDFVAAMLGDAEAMRHYPQTYDRAESAGWIARQRERYERNGYGLWLVRELATGEPVGQVGLVARVVDGMPVDEIGYLIHRPYWRRGFASEAAAAVRDWAFGALERPRLISLIRAANEPSQGLARRIGMEPAGTTMLAGLEHQVYAVSRPTAGSRAP